MVISWCKREIDSLHEEGKALAGWWWWDGVSINWMWTISICMNFPKYSIYLPSLMKQISQGHGMDVRERDRNRWSFCQEESLVVILILESIDSNTNEKVHLVHHFLRQSHSELQCSAMLKMTLLWIFPFNEAIKSSL